MVKMSSNKIWIICTIVFLILLIGIPSFFLVNKDYKKRLYQSTIEKIEYAAKLCFNEDNCSSTTTLQELYDLKYLEPMSNPLTKEIYDPNLTITIENNKATFNG